MNNWTIFNVPKLTIYNQETEFVKNKVQNFHCIFESSAYNNNISLLFYNKKAYEQYVMQTTNETELESKWKKRILLEYTPRGNITMYYDPFKMGFAYNSDHKTISYELLNACAMKYVKIFRCRDFFMDESFYPEQHKNQLLALHYGDEKMNENKDKDIYELVPNVKTGPFIKRRQQSQPSSQPPSQQQKNKAAEPEKMKNKFIYIGKLSNTSFLQSDLQKGKKVLPMFRSALLDSLEQNSSVQDQRLSYKDYKLKAATSST